MPKDTAAQKRIKSIVENNLDGGRIDVLIETREGVSYTISKSSGEQPKVIKADGSPSGLNFTRHFSDWMFSVKMKWKI